MLKFNNNKGFYIIEIVIGISMLSIISMTTFSLLSTLRMNQKAERQEANIDMREIYKQELLFQGLHSNADKHAIDEHGDIKSEVKSTESTLNLPSKCKVKSLNIQFEKERERINASGKAIGVVAAPQVIEEAVLSPPVIHYSEEVDLKDFPLRNLISKASNPLGTYYRYTLDGSEPNRNSPIWNFSDLSLEDWSPVIKFRAFNEDSQYIESNIVTVNLKLKGEIKFKRESGGTSTDVTFSEIKHNTNRIQIIGIERDKNVNVYYKINNGSINEYREPFHIPLDHWSQEDAKLTVFFKVKNAHYRDEVFEKTFRFKIKKERLKPPKIIGSTNAILRKGSFIQIEADKNLANTITEIKGMRQSYDSSASRYYF